MAWGTEADRQEAQRRVDDTIARASVCHMSDTKWRKLFAALRELAVGPLRWKFIRDDRVFVHPVPAAHQPCDPVDHPHHHAEPGLGHDPVAASLEVGAQKRPREGRSRLPPVRIRVFRPFSSNATTDVPAGITAKSDDAGSRRARSGVGLPVALNVKLF